MDKLWLVSVNMGYGHQRSAYPLKTLAYKNDVINANDYLGIPESDKKIWRQSQAFYEAISRFKMAPLVGDFAFSMYDKLQRIANLYPKHDMSRPNIAVREMYMLLKRGWGKDLINKLSRKKMPILTTFYAPAFMAEFYDYPEEIYTVICDTDISRAWVPLNPITSRIKYFAPNERVYERLKLYGVRKKNIYLSGFPLPPDNLTAEEGVKAWKLDILAHDLRHRLANLDPNRKYFERYKVLVEKKLGSIPETGNHPLTILFSVGGAGAQKELGVRAMASLAQKIRNGEVKIILSAGVKGNLKDYFDEKVKSMDLGSNGGVEVLYEKDLDAYFDKFNATLRKTDILWTKPSELSFYAGLGLPILIAPPIGSHEDFNQRWLVKSGFGLNQENPDYMDQWLFDWLNEGYLAEAAMEGFVEGEKLGVLNIKRVVFADKENQD
ncbi:MAG TPA: hypothetical protein P5080_01695 [Candidatus Paceibacterota bacterium]|nr:hypothetical protein [Candidatus Pacearchaeota archaeon]HRZ50698.1 hypothetical protein [Candidatus Paceibacterota bacterium]HSA36405.1 hypothetical protein [Candidatus Paceibacterota bacterium]